MPQTRNDGPLLELSFTSSAACNLSLLAHIRLAQQIWRSNTRLGITGYLRFAEGKFTQAIEGPTAVLMRLIPAILTDSRHWGITITSLRPVQSRSYSGWQTIGFCQAFDPDQDQSHDLPRIAPAAPVSAPIVSFGASAS